MFDLEERIERSGLYVVCTPRSPDPAWGTAHDAWQVRVVMPSSPDREHRAMTVTFHMGAGFHGRKPTAAEVLEALLSDASVVNAEETFEGWCDVYGEDTDSREAHRTWLAARRQTERLRALLGEEFDAWVYESEPD